MKRLDDKEVEGLEDLIEANYGCKIDLKAFLIFETVPERKIWIASGDVSDIFYKNIEINSFGMHFGKLKTGKINLSIEGAHMLKDANKNVLNVSLGYAQKFLGGSNLNPDNAERCERDNYVIVKTGNDVVGTGLLTERGVKNLVPKSRRLSFSQLGTEHFL